MKTTIEMPDALFRKVKAVAATRGQTMKQVLTAALERELRGVTPAEGGAQSALSRVKAVALANAKAWKSELDAVSAVREQRR